MKEFVNDLGHTRYQPELPDGRRFYHRRVGPGLWSDEWMLPNNATSGDGALYARDLRHFRWTARLVAWRQLRREAKHNWKPADRRIRVER